MTEKGKEHTERLDEAAVGLLESLAGLYRDYAEKCRQQVQTGGKIARLFRRWFSGYEPSAADALHLDFLDETRRLVTNLAGLLDRHQNDRPGICGAYAEKAAGILLRPKPAREKTAADWYMVAAEQYCGVLLPFLDRDALRRVRDDYVKHTPKRLMFPKQREVLEHMERMLKI